MDFVNNNIKRLGPRYPAGPHDLYQLIWKNNRGIWTKDYDKTRKWKRIKF